MCVFIFENTYYWKLNNMGGEKVMILFTKQTKVDWLPLRLKLIKWYPISPSERIQLRTCWVGRLLLCSQLYCLVSPSLCWVPRARSKYISDILSGNSVSGEEGAGPSAGRSLQPPPPPLIGRSSQRDRETNELPGELIWPAQSWPVLSSDNCWFLNFSPQVSVEPECWVYSSALHSETHHYQGQSDYTPNNPHILASQDRCPASSSSSQARAVRDNIITLQCCLLVRSDHRARGG